MVVDKPYHYNVRIGWMTLVGALSFGILVPSFFIPLELGSKEHLLAIVVATLTSFVIWEGSKFIQSTIAHYLPWERSIVRRLVFEILSIFVFSSVVLIIGLLSYSQLASTISVGIGVVLRNAFVSFLLALLFTAIKEGAFLFDKWKQSLVEQEHLKKEALEGKLQSLTKQLDPHFLFNSLSVLSGVVHRDPELADTFITKLSQVYRYVLEHNAEQKVKLTTELNVVESYFFLLDVRFQGKASLEIDPALYESKGMVLPLSLQLLVENVFKHNQLSKPLRMRLFAKDGKVWLENSVNRRDNQKNSVGIGLTNLDKRYQLITGKHITVEESAEEFRVGVPLIGIYDESINH